MQTNRFQDHPSLFFVDWCLRGVGQVVFQNNPLSGLVILAALALNSWIYAVVCLLGVVAATGTAVLLKADRALLRDGLFGFNGALAGLALVAFTAADFRTGALPSPAMLVYLLGAAAFTTVTFASLSALLAPYRTAALTAPFVLVGWLFLFAILKFGAIEAGPLAQPAAASVSQTLPGWHETIGTAIGQIFFQDNWLSGYLIVAGIAMNSRIGAAMALAGAIVGTATAALYGGPQAAVHGGLFGYNSALTAMALCGVFLPFSRHSLFYALFGAVVTSWVAAAIGVFLQPIGMPGLTSAFVLTTWLMLLGKGAFKTLTPAE